jgi:translation initiation factor 2B subunit (eIF-2B alpha/beta/delta family)
MHLSQLLHQLQTDNTSGASTLLELAVDILEAFSTQESEPDHDDFHGALAALVQTLLAAQPSMAPLLNLANQACQSCPDTLTPPMARQQLRHMLGQFRQTSRQSLAALCRQTLVVLPPQATVLTYSNSATVIAALHYAHERGRVRRVILSESRPAYDGRQQTCALLAHGIPVEYSVDMALFERLPEAHTVLVGADAIFPHGLVNKVGTQPLAQLAQYLGIPLFSLSTSLKFLPAAAAPLVHSADHPSQEVWPQAPAGVSVRNQYFEIVPLSLCNGIISEHGLYAPAALRTHLQRQELSPTLLSLVRHRTASDKHGAFSTYRGALLEHFQEP